MNTEVPRTRCTEAAADLMKTGSGSADFGQPLAQQPAARRPGGEHGEADRGDQQREPAAVGDLGEVRGEIGAVDNQEQAGQRRGEEPVPAPDLEHQHAEHAAW